LKKLFLVIIAVLLTTSLYAQELGFHNFPWGTSMETFTSRMGSPVHVEEYNGLQSLIYENMQVSGYPAFMLVYFSQNGLEGGTYYFHAFGLDELMDCYTAVQTELLEVHGPTLLVDLMLRELRPYETSWDLPDGYVYLKVNTRWNEPVTLWYSSPSLTRQLRGS